MILNMIVAGLVWNFSSRFSKKINIDPAIASSVFVTTITDVIFFIFFRIWSFIFLY